jgi:prepilin-type processing-associated H-X9-DG protein
MKVPARHSGRAAFGWVHFLVVAALAAFSTALLFPAIRRARQRGDLIACNENLRRIGEALRQYADANGGAMPVSQAVDNPHADVLACLAASHCVSDPTVFYCPAGRGAGPACSDANFKAGNIGYFYYGALGAGDNKSLSKFLRTGVDWPRKLDVSMDKRTWVMSDIWLSGLPTVHAGYRKGINYLMLDGSVDFVGESPRQAFH